MRFLTSQPYYKICCSILFFVAAAASFNGYFDKNYFFEAGTVRYDKFNSNMGLDSVLSGTADVPVVYRQLLPTIANWIDGRLSPKTEDRLYIAGRNGGPSFLARFIDSPRAQERTWFLRFLIVYALSFLFAWFTVYALFQVARAIGYPAPAAVLGAVAFILIVPYFETPGFYYDYPEIAFFALAAWMALKCDWWWIIPVAVFGTLNKETFFVFALTLYPLLRVRNSRLSSTIGTGCIVAPCIAIDGLLWMRFHHNPIHPSLTGASPLYIYLSFIFHFFRYIRANVWEKTYGVPENRAFFLLLLLALVLWTASRGWRHLPKPARRHAQIAAILNTPLALLFGGPGEVRNLSMLYVAFFLLITANLTEWISQYAKVETPQPV